jgi:hypothetical protein
MVFPILVGSVQNPWQANDAVRSLCRLRARVRAGAAGDVRFVAWRPLASSREPPAHTTPLTRSGPPRHGLA